MKAMSLCAASAALIVMSGAPTKGQTSEYFVHSGDQATFSVLQGGVRIRSWGTAPGSDNYQYPITVMDTVRTMGADAGDLGAEYDLDGNDLGPRYQHPLAGSSKAWDGTTDGEFNYAIDTGGDVYRYDREWAGEELLFSTSYGIGSITYDATNNSLWISGFSATTVSEFSMAGVELRSFNTGHSKCMALALDPADDTLWLHDRNAQGTYEQWTREGDLLQRIFIADMAGQNALGGEFAFGEPGPELTVTGDCPGDLTFTSAGNTAGGRVGFLYAFGTGSFVIPGGICAGTELGLNNSVQLGASATAEANGEATVTTRVPQAGCGRVFTQTIDAATCGVSNVVGL